MLSTSLVVLSFRDCLLVLVGGLQQERLLFRALAAVGHDEAVVQGNTVEFNAVNISMEDLRHEAYAFELRSIPPEYTDEEWVNLHRTCPKPLQQLLKHGKGIDVGTKPRRDHLILLEYVEEYPLVLGLPGMASKIETYVRRMEGESTWTRWTWGSEISCVACSGVVCG